MKTTAERFAERTVEFPGDGCHIWIGHRDQYGYGRVWLDGKMRGAHRVAYEAAYGTIPELPDADARGACVLHRCDDPACVNPNHLFVGSHLDNMRDMDTKGRRRSTSRPGERNPAARLTLAAVRDIRVRRAAGATMTSLAREYGLTKGGVAHVVKRRAWRDVQ